MTSWTVPSLETNPSSKQTLPEAPPQQIPTKEDLAATPPEYSFLPSTGVSLTGNCRTATLTMEKSQLLVSRDWISPQHTNKTRSWKVLCCGSLSNGYNTFVGVTQAPSFAHAGFTLVFDSNGDTQYDVHPMLLGFTYQYEYREQANLCPPAVNFGKEGAFPVKACNEHGFQVTVNIEKLTLDVKISTANIRVKLDLLTREGWDQVRLAVLVQPGSDPQRRVKLVQPSAPARAA
jgi:hypothetical protein